MNKRFFVASLIVTVVLSIAVFGCKGKVEKTAEETNLEAAAEVPAPTTEAQMSAQAVVEPAQAALSETIPPTAAVPQVAQTPLTVVTQVAQDRTKEIQTALKNAGLYAGTIDGKTGPRTKKAILDFQKANGLKADGKVGPKTWAALEKYLVGQ